MTQATEPRATVLDVDEIRARRIVVVDEHGEERIRLRTVEDDHAELSVLSSTAHSAVCISSGYAVDGFEDDPQICISRDRISGHGAEQLLGVTPEITAERVAELEAQVERLAKQLNLVERDTEERLDIVDGRLDRLTTRVEQLISVIAIASGTLAGVHEILDGPVTK